MSINTKQTAHHILRSKSSNELKKEKKYVLFIERIKNKKN